MKIWMKIRKPLITGVLILLFYLLQCTVFSVLRLGGIKPDLMMILTVALGVQGGRRAGMLTGFFSGLLIDIQFGTLLGFYALLYLLIGYLNGCTGQFFFDEAMKLALALIGISEFVFGIAVYILQFLLRSEFHFGYFLNHIIIPQVIYTVIAAFVLYPAVLFLFRKLETEEKRSASKFV